MQITQRLNAGGRNLALPEGGWNELETTSFWLQPFLEKGWFRTDEGIPPNPPSREAGTEPQDFFSLSGKPDSTLKAVTLSPAPLAAWVPPQTLSSLTTV
jgi:hypothetical protein